MKTYEIGETFEAIYPPAAAAWCNENGALMVELEPRAGQRVFQIQELPAPPPEKIKEAAVAALKNERNAAEEEPVEYAGTLWDFDARARERIMAAIVAMETTGQPSLEWTAADDTSHQLTVADLRAIVAAAALRADTLHKNYRAARAAV